MNTRFFIKSGLDAKLQAFMESGETMNFPTYSNPEVSIIIVDFNQPALTLNCLNSILITVQIPYEIILIENAPETNALNFINRLSNVEVHINKKNFHFLKGANQGAQIARSQYLLFLNNDTVLYPNAVSIAKNTIEESKKTGIVGAKIILFNGQLQEVGCYLFDDGRTLGVGRGDSPFLLKYSYTRSVDYTAGAFLFIRKSLFEEVGQFDEDYAPAYYEDVDLSLKVQALGYEVVVNPDIIIQHLKNGSVEKNQDLVHPMASVIEANKIKLIQKHSDFLKHQFPFSNNLNLERAKKIQVKSKELIVVMGMHRSGTSAITKSLDAIGIHFGNHLLPPNPEVNKKGFWEDIDIYHFNEKLLSLIKHNWDSIELIEEDKIEFFKSKGYIEEAVQLLNSKNEPGKVFAFKDPRICKLLLFWKEVFKVGHFKVKYIFCLRHPSGVAASLLKRDGIKKSKGLLLWMTYTLNALHHLKYTDYVIVNYDELMISPENEMSRLFSFLGYPVDMNKYQHYISDFIDRDLYHHKQEDIKKVDPQSIAGLAQIIYSSILLNPKNSQEDLPLLKEYFFSFRTLNLVLRFLDDNPSLFLKMNDSQWNIEDYENMKNSNQEIKKLLEFKEEKIAHLELEIHHLRNSWSWKVTWPIRIIFKRIFKN